MYELILVLCALIRQIASLDNGLALTPPMGWMHWQRYQCLTDCDAYPDECVSENLFKKIATTMVRDGYKDAGYEYVIIDDCWMALERDENNKLQADRQRFPSGIKALADFVHAKGLKLGIYADYGTKTCAGYPGSFNYLELDAQTFAEWEVDYLKLDGCSVPNEFSQTVELGYANMSYFLNSTGRPIVFSCSYPAYKEMHRKKVNYAFAGNYCNLWRNYRDIGDSWSDVSNIMNWYIKNQNRFGWSNGPGHWNDPDMLVIGNFGLSYEQAKAQMAIWSILAAPLIMSVDLMNIDPKFREILLNEKAIRINQDPLGRQGTIILNKDGIEFWLKPITGGGCGIAAVSRRTNGYKYQVAISLANLGVRSTEMFRIENVFDKTPPIVVQTHTTIVLQVPPAGGVLLLATPQRQPQLKKVKEFGELEKSL